MVQCIMNSCKRLFFIYLLLWLLLLLVLSPRAAMFRLISFPSPVEHPATLFPLCFFLLKAILFLCWRNNSNYILNNTSYIHVLNLNVSSTIDGFDCGPFQNGMIGGRLVCQGDVYYDDNSSSSVPRNTPLLLLVIILGMALIV